MGCTPFDYITLGLLLVCATAQGWLGMSIWRARRRGRELDERIKEARAELKRTLAQTPLFVQMQTWRELDPQQRQVLREGLVGLLQEMDGTPPPTRH